LQLLVTERSRKSQLRCLKKNKSKKMRKEGTSLVLEGDINGKATGLGREIGEGGETKLKSETISAR